MQGEGENLGIGGNIHEEIETNNERASNKVRFEEDVNAMGSINPRREDLVGLDTLAEAAEKALLEAKVAKKARVVAAVSVQPADFSHSATSSDNVCSQDDAIRKRQRMDSTPDSYSNSDSTILGNHTTAPSSDGASFSGKSNVASATSSTKSYSDFGPSFSFNSHGATPAVTSGGSSPYKLPALARGVLFIIFAQNLT